MDITLPYRYKPRPYQVPMLSALDGGTKRIFALHHRRAGKDVTLWNMIIKKAVEQIGVYYYFLPTYVQAKRIIWDGITNDGLRFIDYIPEELIENKNATELKVALVNGSIIQLIGTDHYDAIRGTNPRGCVFSEYAFQNPMAWEVVKPILKVNGGWAVFNTTPNGKNHAYDLFRMAENSPDWFSEKLSITDTNVLNEEDMKDERRDGMSEDMIQQEYYCSFDVGTLGNYYAKQVKECRERNGICKIPVEDGLDIDVFFDLGRNDSTTMIFIQQLGKEIRVIDYYEKNGEDIAHYVNILKDKGYRLGHLYLPHDGFYKRLEAAKSVAEQFEEAGFKVKRVKKHGINNGIQEVRKTFNRIWFNEDTTHALVRAIENYHKEWDEKKKVFRDHPCHDWASHACDALRYLATGLQEVEVDDGSYEKEARKFAGLKDKDEGLGYSQEEWREYQEDARQYLNN